MAEPLSFVASVIAIATLAGTVATKGRQYIKAVKDCRDDVPKLIAEVNVLCGILERLVVLLGASQATFGALEKALAHGRTSPQHENVEYEGSGASSDCDDETSSAGETLEPPDFIWECQKTLQEIEGILNECGRTSIQSSHFTNEGPRHTFSRLRCLPQRYLKWPLSRSKTKQLFEALERHKITCTIALAKDGLVGIHAVLEQTTVSNKHLAELRAKQEKMLEICITQDQERALAWLSPVNPAQKLQNFRQERQRGTGTWLFDLPEMTEWLETPNAALWIYGIPGAGKTILSTLVIDEVLNCKRSDSVGTAYFYIRHDDTDSHMSRNVIGSLVAQLARQNSFALDDVVQLYAQNNDHKSLATAPEENELNEQLIKLTRHFTNTYIVIDGLDECGSAFDADRKRLIDFVAGLHDNHNKPIRTLIFSREERDIRQRLTEMEYSVVSIAATSADLRLFTSAWIPSLKIQSESLKIEIVDALVNQANGMFMWVRAQVDYLQPLPHDMEKRKALEELPPDLPETYIRIFQSIDSAYGERTKIYIQRLLKWLVLKVTVSRKYALDVDPKLTAEALCQAICIENENDWPTAVNTPTVEQILRWLGCMIHIDQHTDTVYLSHFTVKEFLTMSAKRVAHPVAQRYLVNPRDEEYIANVCLTYSMHSHFKDVILTSFDDWEEFISEHPFWRYVAPALCDHVSVLDGAALADENPLRRFFSMPACRGFQLWGICGIWLDAGRSGFSKEEVDFMRSLSSTLHFASVAGLPSQIRKLLEDGADPNSLLSTGLAVTPLHVAIYGPAGKWDFSRKDSIYWESYFLESYPDKPAIQCSLQISKILIEFGADIDRQVIVSGDMPDIQVTPLVLAVMCANWEVASLLLTAGADWNTTADFEREYCEDLCSIKKLLDKFPEAEHMVQRAVELSRHVKLKNDLIEWRLRQESTCSESGISSPFTNSTNPQDTFMASFEDQDWEKVEELLVQHSTLEVNRPNEQSKCAIHYAAECEGSALVFLLEHGADPNLRQGQGFTALYRATKVGVVKNVKVLLDHGSEVEIRVHHGYTPLLAAVYYRNVEVAQLLVDAGADINATLDDGAGALHIAIQNKDTAMFSLLLEREINSNSHNHYGFTPLHEACGLGLEYEVEQLLVRMVDPSHSLDKDSLIDGTPLYSAATGGYYRVMQRLLDHGAAIDKVGPGNILGSALMTACAEGHSVAVKLLLSRGAALKVEGSRFGSAMETARAFRKEEIVRILEEHIKTLKEEEINRSKDGISAKRPRDEDDPEETRPRAADQEDLALRLKLQATEKVEDEVDSRLTKKVKLSMRNEVAQISTPTEDSSAATDPRGWTSTDIAQHARP